MNRNRGRKCLAVLFLIGILLSATACPKVHADSLYIIRVGLTKQLKQQSSVKVSTKKIALGYCVNNRFQNISILPIVPASLFLRQQATIWCPIRCIRIMLP